MQYQRLTDDASLIVRETGETQLLSSSFSSSPTIKRLRQSVCRLLAIQVLLSLISLVIDLVLMLDNGNIAYRNKVQTFIMIIFSIIYFTNGFLFTFVYFQSGIYTFFWLGSLEYLLICAEIFITFLLVVRIPSQVQFNQSAFVSNIVLIVIFFFQVILMIFILKFTYKLIKAMKSFRRDVHSQI